MDSPTPASTPLPNPVVSPRSSRNFRESPLQISLRAARINLVPGLCVQVLMLVVVLAYYRADWARPWFDRLGELKQSGGYLFTAVAAIIGAALLPEVFRLAWLQRRWPVRRDAAEVLFAVFFWAVNAMCVDRFYRWQSIWFGADATAAIIAKKVVADQFGYTPFFATPVAVVCFAWKNAGYSTSAFRGLFTRTTVVQRVVPTLVANWMVWIPVVAVLYSLPPLLQIPLFSLALCFWALILTYIQTKATPDV